LFLSAASANPNKLYELIISANANVRIDTTTVLYGPLIQLTQKITFFNRGYYFDEMYKNS